MRTQVFLLFLLGIVICFGQNSTNATIDSNVTSNVSLPVDATIIEIVLDPTYGPVYIPVDHIYHCPPVNTTVEEARLQMCK